MLNTLILGLVAPSVTGSDGRASTNWLLGTTAGPNKATATVTSSPSLTGTFDATGTADVATILVTSSPLNQIGPKGGTLPSPIVVTVEDLFGNGVEGETVEFVPAAGSGSVNPTMAVTDASGQASTIWTLEDVVGVQILDVQIPTIPAVVPILFTVDAVTLFLSTVSPDPLREGQAATLTGTGFDPTPANNTVTMDGVAATVTAATATQLDVLVPTFECKPARDVGVTVAAVMTNTVTHAAEPASFLSVGVGQQLLITDPASFCLQFAASAASEAYLIGVQSISEVASGLTDVQLVAAKDPAAPAPPPAPPARLTTQGFTRDLVITDRMRRWSAHREAHASFQSRQSEWLNRSAASLQMASGPAAIPSSVTVGDMLSINVPDVNSSNTCLNFTTITAEVKHVGTRGVFLEDTGNPPGGFSTADYQSQSDALDNTIFDTDAAYFGTPTDMDGNSQIGIVVTKEVNNKTNPPLGFVSFSDLFSVASGCTSSNEGELYYGRAPDAGGAAGPVYTLADAQADVQPLIAHEFVHVIQGGVRITAGAPTTVPFLSTFETEGQATLGEEVVGHAVEGNSAGQNYDNTIAIGPGAVSGFKWYEAQFLDMAQYFGWDSQVMGGLTKVSNAPQQCTWLDVNAVSDGSDADRPCVGGRQPYGVPWSFLRWLNDQIRRQFRGWRGGPPEGHRQR